MSTTFEVFPGNNEIPAFESILDHANSRVNYFLKERGLPSITLKVSFYDEERNSRKTNCTGPFCWKDDGGGARYAWFHVANVNGGTDAYYHDLAVRTWNREYFDTVLVDLEQNNQSPFFRDTLRNTLEVDTIGHFVDQRGNRPSCVYHMECWRRHLRN